MVSPWKATIGTGRRSGRQGHRHVCECPYCRHDLGPAPQTVCSFVQPSTPRMTKAVMTARATCRAMNSRLLKKGSCWLDLADRVSSSHVLVRPK